MRWIILFACWTLAAKAQPEFSREEPKAGVMGYRDGRLLLGRDVDVPGTGAVRLAEEDRDGTTLREYSLKPEGGPYTRFRVTTAALTADGDVVAGGVAMETARRMQNLVVLGGRDGTVGTGGFSCWVVAAATKESAWCLGYSLAKPGEVEEQRHLLYRVGADGKAAAFYPLPMQSQQRTAEGLSRFPALGLPALWANADGAVWAWLPGDRKLARFREKTGRLETWDVPVPKGGTAGVSMTVTSGGRAIALLPVSQDGVRVAPGPSPIFGMFELNMGTGQWERSTGIPEFRRGAKLVGSDEGTAVVSNPETGKLEWYGVR